MRNDTKQILNDKALKEELLIALQYVVDNLNNGTTKEEIFDNLEDLKKYGLKIEEEEKEIVSNCCGASLNYIYEDLCGQCLEHCEPIEI